MSDTRLEGGPEDPPAPHVEEPAPAEGKLAAPEEAPTESVAPADDGYHIGAAELLEPELPAETTAEHHTAALEPTLEEPTTEAPTEPEPAVEPEAAFAREPATPPPTVEAYRAPEPAPPVVEAPPAFKPAPVIAPPGPRRAPRSWRRRLLDVAGLALAFLVIGPIFGVLFYRFIPVPITFLMVERAFEGRGLDHRWVPISKMSPTLVRAAIGAEDANFCEHHGFDFGAIQKAMQHDERKPNKIRGGSTISQQTAKNVFLWPDRSWVRKGYEAYLTVLIEAVWGKRRIMEVYLNTVEMGPGVYGVEAAAQRDFNVSAAQVSPLQAARLISVLPNPLKWQAVDPGAYVRRRSGRIDAREGQVRRIGSDDCVL